MKIEVSFLRSKLGRRIFWLFVVCAIVPISLLMVVSLRDVMGQLNEQSRRQLKQSTKDEAMAVCQKLVYAEGDLKLIGEALKGGGPKGGPSTPPTLPASLTKPFRTVEVLKANGEVQLVRGQSPRRVTLNKGEQTFLAEGKTVLSTMHCDGDVPCIFLSWKLEGETGEEARTLTGELDGPAFWDKASLPEDTNLCVLDAEGQVLFCSGKRPGEFPKEATKSFSGEFDWEQGGKQYLSRYWNLPLAGAYFTPHWTVVSSEAKIDVFAPLARFKTSYLSVSLLTLWIVVLLSVWLIRRNLIPLGKLKEGTKEIAAGNYRARVQVKSADEFEELAGSFNSMADRIEKQMHSLRVANEIDRAILSAWDIQKVVTTVATRIGELVQLDLVSITLFEAEHSSSAASYVFDRLRARKLLKYTIQLNAGELKNVSEWPEVSVVEAGETLPSFSKPLIEKGMQSFLMVPILLEKRPAAVISLARGTASEWSEEDKQNARQLGDQAGVALANSELVKKLNEVHWGALAALARAIDAKSSWTLGHSERVTDFALKMARAMGIKEKELEVMRRGGLLHDIGKIGVSAAILDKPGKLTPDELAQMREHVNIGVKILQPVPGFEESMPIVAQHHEWINGNGYPNGLKGDEVTLHARIFAVADCFDALISDRPYRPGLPVQKVIEIIKEGSGTQFDPKLVELFEKLVREDGAKPVKTAQEEVLQTT